MGDDVLLVLIERPSFLGELSIQLVEEGDPEGHAKYFLVCQKRPPLNNDELIVGLAVTGGAVAGGDLGEIWKSISWKREVPLPEAESILAILENRVESLNPECVLGLDGTTYELLIERGFNKVRFTWWSEPPAVWQALGELSKILLERADAASVIEALQSSKRKRLIRRLKGEIDETQKRRENERAESLRRHNVRCNELAQSLRATGMTCPHCNMHSSDVRFVDESPAASYFICQACGRSFRPEDLKFPASGR